MPVSVNRGPFTTDTVSVVKRDKLRIPQVRILAALMPDRPSDPRTDWPLLTRAYLAVRAGYTPISGSVTRALNGIRPGSSSDARGSKPGQGHLGLIARGYVDDVPIDLDGLIEANYRITATGIVAYQSFIAEGGRIPPLKPAEVCINKRYKGDISS